MAHISSSQLKSNHAAAPEPPCIVVDVSGWTALTDPALSEPRPGPQPHPVIKKSTSASPKKKETTKRQSTRVPPATVHQHNVRHILENLARVEPLHPDPRSVAVAPAPSAPNTTLGTYLARKRELFPDAALSERKPHTPRNSNNGDISSDGSTNTSASSTPRERPAKRVRFASVEVDDAMRWTAVIGRLVKGKARLTPEMLGEVADTLAALEAKRDSFSREVLQDGIYDMVELLAETQDSVYALEGLRTRAKALVDVWRWKMTR